MDYPEVIERILAAYPVATESSFMINRGERQRVSFDFNETEKTERCLRFLSLGIRNLAITTSTFATRKRQELLFNIIIAGQVPAL